MFNLGTPELLIVGVIALLLFGKKLPEVARSLGKGVVEFKKGLRGIEEEIDTSMYSTQSRNETTSTARPMPKDESVDTSAPKFDPPKTEPT